MPCHHSQDGSIVVCAPVSRRVYAAHHEVRWCFGCRAYHKHEAVWIETAEPSYYDPVAVWECDGCGGDHTDFPLGW